MGIKKLALFALLLSLVGCKSFDKEHFKARNFYEKNKPLLASLCASEFPSETKFIKGESTIKRDTTYIDVPYQIDCDSVVNANKGTEKKNIVNGKVKSPHIKEKESVTDTVVKPNTAYESKLRYQINDLEADNTLLVKENKGLKDDLNASRWIIGIMGSLMVVGLIVIIKK